MRSAEIDFQ